MIGRRLFGVIFSLLLISGCATYGRVDNQPLVEVSDSTSYSLQSRSEAGRSGDIALLLAFSGGGTRAAALSYGVLEELRDTEVVIEGQRVRLLDQVDVISSVSGGSFTAAYYGLYGERLFEDFEQAFLRRDVEGYLLRQLFNPFAWLGRVFSRQGRTEMAIQYYDEILFHGATFADLKSRKGPLILINASGLGYGVRFSFVQESFDLLCSDLLSFPVARAVTASSSVPVLFEPVVLENYADCDFVKPPWVLAARKRADTDPEMAQMVSDAEFYLDKDRIKYAHMVDGGITDNLGLRAIYNWIELPGGVEEALKFFHVKPPRQLVIISVNASTDPRPEMALSNKEPSLGEAINAVTDTQLHRYNTDTIELMQDSVTRWAHELSTPERPVTPYFIQLGLNDVDKPEWQRFLNRIPTSFSLTGEQVDRLIKTGHELLRNNRDYRRLVAELGGRQADR